ncbi:MAG: NosD domain-containing protein [Anaerolineae bacterium]|jgi:hypothetical protein
MDRDSEHRRYATLRERRLAVALCLLLAGAAIGALSLVLSGPPAAAVAAPTGEWHVCPAGPNTCNFASIQEAVDAAQPGDVIKVAEGVYTDMHVREGMTQVVFITESVTVRGGYTTSNWETPDPDSHPTTLDAGGTGRVAVIEWDNGRKVTVTLESLRLTNGRAFGNDHGGGVYAGHTNLVITGCQVFSNAASVKGGGLYLIGTHEALLQANEIYSNSAEYGGGGNIEHSHDVQVIGNRVYQNRADNSGGGMLMYSSHRAVVLGNVIHASRAVIGGGGGLTLGFCDGGLVGQNDIFGNLAHSSGGGMQASTGTAGLTVVENEFYDNVSETGNGGGLSLSGVTNARVMGNRVGHNEASQGGGIALTTVGTATLEGNQVYSNSVSHYGGGGYLYNSEPFTMVNNVIVGNAALSAGGGLYLTALAGRQRFGYLIHNTLADNRRGNGGQAVYLQDHSTLNLTNNIIAGHTVALYARPGYSNAMTADHTLFFNNDSDTGGSSVLSKYAIAGQDPGFVDPDGWDYHIRLGSPAVDAGTAIPWLADDVDGDSRPYGDGYDIGADEVWPALIYLPLVVRAMP